MEVLLVLALVLAVVVVVFYLVLYRWQGAPDVTASPSDALERRGFVVRTYVGRQQQDVLGRYVADAEELARHGYEPVGQSWGDGQWESPVFLLALILCLFGVGLILLAYMAIIRPAGTLVVTYKAVRP